MVNNNLVGGFLAYSSEKMMEWKSVRMMIIPNWMEK